MTDIEQEMNQIVAEMMQGRSPGLYAVVKDLVIKHGQSPEEVQANALKRKPHTPTWLLIQIAMTAKHIQETENA